MPRLFLVGEDMIIGIGTDIVEIDRVAKAIKGEAFVKRVFTPAEAEYCHSRKAGMAASFAGRFAAKEAIMKALGTGLREGSLTELEILNDQLGCPKARLTGRFLEIAKEKGMTSCHISISHSMAYATAQCVMEGQEQGKGEEKS